MPNIWGGQHLTAAGENVPCDCCQLTLSPLVTQSTLLLRAWALNPVSMRKLHQHLSHQHAGKQGPDELRRIAVRSATLPIQALDGACPVHSCPLEEADSRPCLHAISFVTSLGTISEKEALLTEV